MQLPNDFTSHTSPDHFGALLKWLRDRHGLAQGHIVGHLPDTIDQQRYSSFELNKRSPTFDELSVIYQALKDAGVRLSLRDRGLFLDLAKRQLESKRTHKVHKLAQEWSDLRTKLATIDQLPDTAQISITRSAPLSSRMEISHLIGRESWLNSLYEAIAGERFIKWGIIQGPPGIGKTSELHRIATYFQQHIPRYYVALCQFPEREQEQIRADVALELLLGDILESIGLANIPMPVTSLQARIQCVLDGVARADRPVLILLDNAEHLLDEQGHLTSVWKQFYEKFVQTRHRASLILATKEWPTWLTVESQWAKQFLAPLLEHDEGILLLQRLGLHDLPVEQLGPVVDAVGGIPICLEWVAKLMKDPLLQGDWSSFEDQEDDTAKRPEKTKAQRLAHLLEDSSLFGGPVASRVNPLLDRVIRRLSAKAVAALNELALAPVPLGAAALKVLYHDPIPLQELRDASLLVSYIKRVRLLPMVAAQVRKGLAYDQMQVAEDRLIQALTHWLNKGIPNTHEQGVVFTELACLLLRRHRFLAAAELVLYHGWLSSHVGQMLRLAQLVQQMLDEREEEHSFETEIDVETECGGLLLHYYLAPYLGESVDEHARAEAYRHILALVSAGQVKVEPLMQVHVVEHIMRDFIAEDQFEEALDLFNDCLHHFQPLLVDDAELHATLLSKQAVLYNRWSGFARSKGLQEEARQMQGQTIVTYEACLDLLEKALQKAEEGTLRQSTLRKKKATFLNNLAYHYNMVGRFEEALKAANSCIDLKKQGYAERDSLAASYGEKSQILAALGLFQEALRFDELAREEIRRCAEAGDTSSQDEQWIYQVNQGRLYLLLGRVDEASRLLEEAEPKIKPRRRIYQIMAQDALLEIEQGRTQSAPASFQLDWRWVKRYRKLSAYDAYWWWAHAGSFTVEEQERWDQLFVSPIEEESKNQLRELLLRSRDRELEAALAEHREPNLRYPAIEIDLVRKIIADFLALDAEVDKDEPNSIVRRLYRGAIEDEICFLRMIEATCEGDTQRFWELSQQLYPLPAPEEMQYALGRVKQIISQGLRREDIVQISHQVLQVLRDIGISLNISVDTESVQSVQKKLSGESSQRHRMVSVQTAKRFFETVLKESGYDGWQVMVDPNASGPRVESALRQVFLQDSPLSLEDIREYLAHEFLGHATRSFAGEQSLLGLLGMGTQGYMPTEEGIADYHERHVALLHGQPFDDSGAWLGTLSVGLASGVTGSLPLTFTSFLSFFEPFLLLYRLLWRNDEDLPTAKQRARRNALIRCLRTYRGVSDLIRPGICLTKDGVYLRGHLQIEQAVAEDETILDRLAVGKVSLDLLPDIEELGITAPQQVSVLRKRAYDPELDNSILSFEQEDTPPSSQDL